MKGSIVSKGPLPKSSWVDYMSELYLKLLPRRVKTPHFTCRPSRTRSEMSQGAHAEQQRDNNRRYRCRPWHGKDQIAKQGRRGPPQLIRQ